MKCVNATVSGTRSLGKNNDRLSSSEILTEALDPVHRLGDVASTIDEGVSLHAQYPRDRGKPAAQLPFGDKPYGMVAKGGHDRHDIDNALVVGENYEPIGVVAIVKFDLQSKPGITVCDCKKSTGPKRDVAIHDASSVGHARGDAYLIDEIPPY